MVEQYLAKYIGESPVLYMLIGLVILILLNLVLSVILAHKSKDGIKLEMIPDFIKPLLLYGAFLLCSEAMILATKIVPLMYDAAKGFQAFAFCTIVIKYFKQVYSKLKQLGLQTSPDLDKKVDDLTPGDGSSVVINEVNTDQVFEREDER